MEKALGLIELVGKAAAVVAMDTAIKTADVALAGLESSRGGGRMTVKLQGGVSAVKMAVEAAVRSVEDMGGAVFAVKVIPSPSDELGIMLSQTMGRRGDIGWRAPRKTEEDVMEAAEAEEAEKVEPAEAEDDGAEAAQIPAEDQEPAEEGIEKQTVCNLCLDPRCPRVRGEARTKCMHYKDIIRKQEEER
ncbi:BMC domain-containing protein [Bacilliculturomica massiliensis]|uniref:BMC domain-containing protein n=1 Tax=Bacilliculturomica massiliensis TaxID=1917867 RepID=UPI0013EF1076|nr:BMC domain-containing protein [Bacilliculturomica massiliensis]